MSVEMQTIYRGQLSCDATHGPSQNTIQTDAPKDNAGLGRTFSPTDLVGVALGTCMLTTLAIYAERNELDVAGASAEVTKEMIADPQRRIGRLGVTFTMPEHVGADPETRTKLERAAAQCPVKRSLHPDTAIDIEFRYG